VPTTPLDKTAGRIDKGGAPGVTVSVADPEAPPDEIDEHASVYV
jgi:hypothetical protein